MWGDESDSDSPQVDPMPTLTASKPVDKPATIKDFGSPIPTAAFADTRPPAPPTASRSETIPRRTPDPLEAIVAVDREPPVPGFDVPEDRSPGAAKTPQRRSAWDALISTLGIRTSSDAVGDAIEKPAAPEKTSVEKVAPQPRAAEPRDDRGRDRDDRGRRKDQRDYVRDEPSDEGVDGGFGAGLLESNEPARRTAPGGDEPEATETDRPRGRGRRGGSRRRGRGRDSEAVAKPQSESDIDWELSDIDDEIGAAMPQARATDADLNDQPVSPGDDDRDEFEGRPRRSRRRGQRQMLSVDDLESGRTGSTDFGRTASARGADETTDRPRRREEGRREESVSNDRNRRMETARGESSKSENARSVDSPRGESGRREGGRPERGQRPPRPRADEAYPRAVARSEGSRSESVRGDDDFIDFEDDVEGFGSGLLADPKPPAGEGDEPRPRRRRRGRRGRGGAPREERPEIEGGAELIDAPDDLLEAPSAFDDDLEDDVEADRLRRRTRGGRSRGGRRSGGEREPAAVDRDADPAPRATEFGGEAKSRNVPTWLDTVSLLVDANIQRRAAAGGNRNQGSQNNQGRGGRR